ncbi:lipopolysaccharide transport periplasmic protein LptA [Sandarakinorhabdus sp. AAP62]|uniref:lipopolysaccharide transport periplasmic protein LptA n=1 Tax=Sandarakinorhabdus sp. AAP62 TaxID=1248916 RepID=UPI0002EB6EB4|nr:lipopolysaccharide transport periplasmic protein LptA [Sandarakinorhabdus sp. AAP62]
MRLPFVIMMLLASPVAAQRFDSNAPIDVDAGRIDIADDSNEAIFSGAVVIRQGSMILNADRVRISYAKDSAGNPQVQRLDALGNVRLRQDTMRATSNSGVYDVNGKLVTLIGNVKLDRGTDHLEGARVVWNLASRTTSFDARSASNPGGRVTGRFTVPQKKN